MNNKSEFVLEFVVHSISCKNTSVRSSPLIITLAGCPDILLNAKSATVCKITYEKGKRISFSHSHLMNLKASFVLVKGHGDQTIRAACSFDFFELTSVNDEFSSIVYELEVGMDKPNGDRFGIMSCSFQIMPVFEYQKATTQTRFRTTTSTVQTPRKLNTQRVISVGKQSQPNTSRSVKPQSITAGQSQKAPMLFQSDASYSSRKSVQSSRSALGSSIHERYMKKNELWIGNHCSTRSEDQRPKRTLSVSRSSSSRGNRSSRNTNDY